ncbi:MAG: hypothetical protein AB8B55_24365 [Mariniblastus sp.]
MILLIAVVSFALEGVALTNEGEFYVKIEKTFSIYRQFKALWMDVGEGFDPELFHDDDGRKYFAKMRWRGLSFFLSLSNFSLHHHWRHK